MDIQVIQQQIIEEFSAHQDRLAKYEYLIGLGQSLAPLDKALKTDNNAVSGCQSKVWISSKILNGRLRFFADSDALITKGIIALLLRVLDDQTPHDILKTELFFIEAIGLKASLSPARSNGLVAMVKKMRADAKTFST